MKKPVLSSKGQLYIPTRIRKKYRIKPRMKLVLKEADNAIIIQPLNEKFFESFMGILRSDGELKEEMKKYKQEEKKLEDRKLNSLKKKNTK